MGLIQGYEAPASAGKYDGDVAEFVKAYESSDDKKLAWQLDIAIPSGTDADKEKQIVSSNVRSFQQAAHKHGYSALVSGDKEKNGDTIIVRLVLGERRTREVKPADTDAVEEAAPAKSGK